jgi:acyl-CoA thioester hydrolase
MAAPFRHRHRVSYADCTVGNHIYYARYLDILEEARGEFFRAAGVSLADLQAQDIAFPVIEAHLHYEAPARYDDELIIEVEMIESDRLNLVFAYGVSNDRKQIILTARTRHVCASMEHKPKRMPSEVFFKLNPTHPAAPQPIGAPTAPAPAPRAPKSPIFPA